MTFVCGLLQTTQPTCWRLLTPDPQLSFLTTDGCSQSRHFTSQMQGFMGIVGYYKISFLFRRVCVCGEESTCRAICSGVKTKKEASSKDIVECLRGSQLLSVLLDISGSYNMKSSIYLGVLWEGEECPWQNPSKFDVLSPMWRTDFSDCTDGT